MELILPRRCAGCGRGGELLCAACRVELARPPQLVTTRSSPHVPVYALAPYAGAHRSLVLAMKERRNTAVRRHVGAVLGAALTHLGARGDLPPAFVLVPAPTRRRSARLRGGDPVEQICRASGVATVAALRLAPRVADQSELGAEERLRNLAGAVRLVDAGVDELRSRPAVPVVLVDDVVTTGATLTTSAERLIAAGVTVAAAVVVCSA